MLLLLLLLLSLLLLLLLSKGLRPQFIQIRSFEKLNLVIAFTVNSNTLLLLSTASYDLRITEKHLVVSKQPCSLLSFYNNQINARALIDQSAVVYCASKRMQKSRVF